MELFHGHERASIARENCNWGDRREAWVSSVHLVAEAGNARHACPSIHSTEQVRGITGKGQATDAEKAIISFVYLL